MRKVLHKFTAFTLLYVCCALLGGGLAKAQGSGTDDITAEVLGLTGSYKDFAPYTSPTTRVKYEGNAYARSQGIQIRTDKSESGIIATSPGANLTSISITFNSTTLAKRSVIVYGKNTPYTSAKDIYISEVQGELLGELTPDQPSLTITGSYANIGLRSADGTVYMDQISFTWGEGTGTVKTDPKLSFDQSAATAVLGQPFTAPALSAPEGLSISYTSSNPAAATVDANTGDVTLVAAGTTTITAASEANDTYLAGKASYTLTVSQKETPSEGEVIFEETFDQCAGTGGNDGQWSGNIATTKLKDTDPDKEGWTFSNGFVANQCAKFGSGSKAGSATTPALTQLNGTATLTFRAGAWSSDKTTLQLSIDGGGELSQTEVEMVEGQFTDYTVTITNGTPDTRITFSAATSSKNRFFLDEVKVKASASVELPITTDEGYGTIYSDKAFVMPADVMGTTVTEAKADGTLSLPWQYTEGDVVPARTALLLFAMDKKTYTAEIAADNTDPAPANNLLHGADATDANGYTYVAGNSPKYYILSYDLQEANLGFYYAEADGAAVPYQAPHAFLAVTGDMTAQSYTLDLHPTGIHNATAGQPQKQAIYTLSGLRVNAPLSSLPEGIYIVNGKKVVVNK